MKQVKSSLAEFQFNEFVIKRSLFERLDKKISKSLGIFFIPSGKFDSQQNRFELFLGVRIKDKNEALKIEIDAVGYFILRGEQPEQLLKNYLFRNAPAILFPYLRAYISSLSTLSGAVFPVVLPTLNMTNIGNELETNTEFI